MKQLPALTPTARPKAQPPATTYHPREVAEFREVMAAADGLDVVAALAAEEHGPPWRLQITVNDKWQRNPQPTRLAYVRAFRGAWRGVWPPAPGGCKVAVTVVDGAGVVVGEATWSETALWAK